MLIHISYKLFKKNKNTFSPKHFCDKLNKFAKQIHSVVFVFLSGVI